MNHLSKLSVFCGSAYPTTHYCFSIIWWVSAYNTQHDRLQTKVTENVSIKQVRCMGQDFEAWTRHHEEKKSFNHWISIKDELSPSIFQTVYSISKQCGVYVHRIVVLSRLWSFTGTYFWFHEGEHQGFGRRRQQAGVWVQNQGDCLMTRGQEGGSRGGGREWERRDLNG